MAGAVGGGWGACVPACVCVYIYCVGVRACVRARAGFIGGPLQGLLGNGIPDHQLQPQSTHEQRGKKPFGTSDLHGDCAV